MLVKDLDRVTTLEQLSVAADGRAAVVVSRVEFAEDRYHRHIVVIGPDGELIDLTHGPSDSRPRWSPDGTRVAFLRQSDPEGMPQVAVIAVGGGEAHTVTDFPIGATDLCWSPDGHRLVVVGTEWVGQRAGLDEAERDRLPRRIRTMPYRSDNLGWTHDRRSRLWVVDPSGSAPTVPLTSGEADESRPVWSPDGHWVAFLTDRTGRTVGSTATEVWEARVDTGEVVKRAELGYWTTLSYRPDGALHAVGIDDFDDWPAPLALWRSEETEWTNLTAHLDRTVPASFTDVSWLGNDAVLLLDDRGSTGIVRVEPEGITHHLTRRDLTVTSCAAVPSDEVVVYVAATMVDPGELRRLNVGSSQESVLTGFNAGFREEVPLVEGHHFEVVSGGVDIDAWAYLPVGDAEVPLLLNIHGGPAAQYGLGFFDEFQVYATAGFGVVACNPHGSSGRGRDFLKSVTGDGWGVVDLADVRAVVSAALERFPRLSANRLGVMGGSYGGFLTAWLIAHDDRYRSAIVERALLSWPSFAGTSDIGASFPSQYLLTSMPAGQDDLWAKSPLAVAHRIATPTLVLHSEKDLRCPISQAEEFFSALLTAGTTAELLRFPGESHELTRSGKPRHRQERFEAILDWHGRFLAGNEGADGENRRTTPQS